MSPVHIVDIQTRYIEIYYITPILKQNKKIH